MTLLANSKVAELQQELDRRKAEYEGLKVIRYDQDSLFIPIRTALWSNSHI